MTSRHVHWTLLNVRPSPRMAIVRFGAKGKVSIPPWLCQEFGITKGTRVQASVDRDLILLRPRTLKWLRRLRGTLKGAGVLDTLMEDRRRERRV